MTERRKNRRAASRFARHVEVCRDVQPRLALEGELFNSIAWSVDDSCYARIEGSSLERTSQHAPEIRDDCLLPRDDFLSRGDGLDGSLAPIVRIIRNANLVPFEIVRIVRQRRRLEPQLHTWRPRRPASGRLSPDIDRPAEARCSCNCSCRLEEFSACVLHDVFFVRHIGRCRRSLDSVSASVVTRRRCSARSRYRRGVTPSSRMNARLITSALPKPTEEATCFRPPPFRSSRRRAASTRICNT